LLLWNWRSEPRFINDFSRVRSGGRLLGICFWHDGFEAAFGPERREEKGGWLEIAATDKQSARMVGAQSVRRLVLGSRGYGDATNVERIDRNKLSPSDKKIALKALQDTMEYIEVVHLWQLDLGQGVGLR